jgi:hypothetical protein
LYRLRANVLQSDLQDSAALADFERYLALGGGPRDRDTAEVKEVVRYLRGES